MEIVKRIREVNEGKKYRDHPLPTSDIIYKKYLADIVNSPDKIPEYLRWLADAHYLFIITMVEPDERLMIDGVYGYVAADPVLVRNLREVAYRDLEAAYEQQFYRRKQALVVTRELLPQVRTFNNTHLGRSLNFAIMLQQYEHVLLNALNEYSDAWRRRKLEELVPELAGEDGVFPESAPSTPMYEADPLAAPPDYDGEGDSASPQRAVDSGELAKVQEMDRSGRWGDAVDKYGVQFLVRIHFRKYEFDRVRWLMRTNKIAREEDLRFVRDTVRLMESRFEEDTKLPKYARELAELKRLAQMKLNQIFLVKKKMGQA